MDASANPWQPRPEINGGTPLWAADPEQVIAPRPQWDDDTLLALSLMDRYPGQGKSGIMDSYQEDLLPNTIVPVTTHPKGLFDSTGRQLYGRYSPEEGAVHLNTAVDPVEQLAAFPHELGHALDDFQSYDFGAGHPTGDVEHHKYFVRFEPEMAQSIEAQKAIEQGLPVHPAILARYPWLRDVKPASSNRLANPWNIAY